MPRAVGSSCVGACGPNRDSISTAPSGRSPGQGTTLLEAGGGGFPAKKSNLEIPKLKRFSPSISSSAQPTIPVRRCRITTSLPIPEGRGIRPCDKYYRIKTISIITRERGRGGACATDLRSLSVRRKKVTEAIRTQAQACLSHGRVQRGQTVVESLLAGFLRLLSDRTRLNKRRRSCDSSLGRTRSWYFI